MASPPSLLDLICSSYNSQQEVASFSPCAAGGNTFCTCINCRGSRVRHVSVDSNTRAPIHVYQHTCHTCLSHTRVYLIFLPSLNTCQVDPIFCQVRTRVYRRQTQPVGCNSSTLPPWRGASTTSTTSTSTC